MSELPNFSSHSNVLPIPEPSSVVIPPMLHYSHTQKSCPNSITNPSPIMIISDTCKIRPDHYKVSVSEGKIHLHSVVQDYLWPGVLVVICFVAENEREIVAECVGRDEQGNRIIWYLVVEKGLVDRSWTIWRLPKALGEDWYMSCGSMVSRCLFHILFSHYLILFLLCLFLCLMTIRAKIPYLLLLFFLAFSGVSDCTE
jgi:hypothetical protein